MVSCRPWADRRECTTGTAVVGLPEEQAAHRVPPPTAKMRDQRPGDRPVVRRVLLLSQKSRRATFAAAF